MLTLPIRAHPMPYIQLSRPFDLEHHSSPEAYPNDHNDRNKYHLKILLGQSYAIKDLWQYDKADLSNQVFVQAQSVHDRLLVIEGQNYPSHTHNVW